jgi:anti-sigma factor RsiW
MSHECDQLDAYLADDLSCDDHARFETHLSQCEACREAIDQQRWIDAMLCSPLRMQLEPVPTNLVQRPVTATPPRGRRVLIAACGLVSAAAVLIALSWSLLNRQAMNNPNQTSNTHSTAKSSPAHVERPPVATFVGGPDVIAVPIASRAPNVTIVQIYPTYQPRQEEKTVAAYSNTATNSSLPDYYNGG